MKAKFNKIFDVIIYVFIFLAGIFTIITISAKKDSNDAFSIFGYKMMVVETGSMEKSDLFDVSEFEIKSIKKDALIIVKEVPKENQYEFYADIEQYDVLTFKYLVGSRQETITHRVIGIVEYDDGFVFTLRGDNINADGTTSTQVIDTREVESFNYIIGKVESVNYPIGLLMTALKSKVGIVLMIILPCGLLIGLEVAKIVNELNMNKKIKALKKEEELDLKNQELEELRKKLQALENKENEVKEECDDGQQNQC